MKLLLVLLAVIALAEGHAAYWDLPVCGLCKDLVGYLKGKLEGGVTDVQQLAHEFCNENAPWFLQSACTTLVNDKMGEIIAKLMNKIDVESICTQIKLC